ncbi:MAG TPA: hypothetical protein VMZ04_01890 [Anaerolineae bacterium]|nr:hypothetical protein [Anaerolineae bacterium]
MKQRDFYKFDAASVDYFDDEEYFDDDDEEYFDDDDDEYIRMLAQCHSENIMMDQSIVKIQF